MNTGLASRTCQGREPMTLFLLNPSIGLNLFSWVVGSEQQYIHLGWINSVLREVIMHRVLADASIMCAKASKKSLHPGFVVPTIPSYANQILGYAGP